MKNNAHAGLVRPASGPFAVFLSLTLAALAGLGASASRAGVPLEVYGHLPSIEDVAVSPGGSRLAFVRTDGDARMVVVVSMADRKAIAGLRVGTAKLRDIKWADEDNLMLTTSMTTVPRGFIGSEHEWSMLQVYNVPHKRSLQFPGETLDEKVDILNALSGEVMVRQVRGRTLLFVPGMYVEDVNLPALFRCDPTSGTTHLMRRGTRTTEGWLVDDSGDVIAEEDYDEGEQRWAVKIRRGHGLEEVASGHAAIEAPELLGFGPTADTLLMQMLDKGDPVWRLMSMKDGSLGTSLAERAVLEEPIEDPLTHLLIGGTHVEDVPEYLFFDSSKEARWESIVGMFPGERVQYVSSSADFSKVVVLLEGVRHGYRYALVDFDTQKAVGIGEVYRGITVPLEVQRLTYGAADGMKIPAYLTLPARRPAKNLPLIVLPHGGPAARDTAEFDWWSQALADQGYAVLRPNYRGSTLTRDFLEAGFGQWGRKMQTDLSDGVRYLVKSGIADPARVCIVGASYGGYAALAGVTLDPTVYRCAVSVAGISDLSRMLKWEDEERGQGDRRALRYWDRFWGVSGANDPALDAISPIKHIDAVHVPVLLIHGRDDTVVPFEQSQIMFDALRHAAKDVQLVTLKHEDHWLSHGETRLQMLQETVAFLRAHNPPD